MHERVALQTIVTSRSRSQLLRLPQRARPRSPLIRREARVPVFAWPEGGPESESDRKVSPRIDTYHQIPDPLQISRGSDSDLTSPGAGPRLRVRSAHRQAAPSIRISSPRPAR